MHVLRYGPEGKVDRKEEKRTAERGQTIHPWRVFP